MSRVYRRTVEDARKASRRYADRWINRNGLTPNQRLEVWPHTDFFGRRHNVVEVITTTKGQDVGRQVAIFSE